MWIVGLLSVSFFLHVLAVDWRLHERLCCHAAPFIDNNGIHGWFIAWGHEYFFSVNNTDFLFTRIVTEYHGFSFFLLVTNYRIIEFCLHTEYRGQSRIFFFLFLSRIFELSNFNHTEYHGQSRIFLFCHETCPWTHWPQGGNFRIIEFLSSVTFRDSPCDKRKFANSQIRDKDYFVTFRDLPCDKR